MNKHLLIAATAAALILPGVSSRVLAEPPEHATEHHELSAEDMAAFTDARIAALKAGLKLTPAEEKNWPTLETALRDAAKAHASRAAEWREKAKELHEKHNVIEGIKLHAKGLLARGAEMEKIADAAKPLFDTLDDAQKRRFGILVHHVLHGHDGGMHGHWGMHGGASSEHEDAEHHE